MVDTAPSSKVRLFNLMQPNKPKLVTGSFRILNLKHLHQFVILFEGLFQQLDILVVSIDSLMLLLLLLIDDLLVVVPVPKIVVPSNMPQNVVLQCL